MEGHDEFFGWVVGLIPRDLYSRSAEDEDNGQDSKYYKHRKVPLKPEEKKLISKAKKEKIYSRNSQDSEEIDAIAGEAADEPNGDTNEDGNVEEMDVDASFNNPGSSNSMESLRERLQLRILGLQKERRGKKGEKQAVSKIGKKTDKKTDSSKHKFSGENRHKIGSSGGGDGIREELQDGGISWTSLQRQHQPEEGDNGSAVDVDVNNFLLDSSGTSKDAMAGKPGTKMLRLKRMLNEATKKRQRIESLVQEGDEGKKRAREEAWTDALKSASGEKVSHDTTRLRKAIKRREKQKQKSTEEWRDRKESIEEKKNAKADKREANILQRKNGGVPADASGDKQEGGSGGGGRRNKFTERVRNDRIAEKKAGGGGAEKGGDKKRPGFEGKKGTFLNSQGRKKE